VDGDLAGVVAAAYALGAPHGPLVYADRGERGRIWRLETDRGRWAVKEADTSTDPEPVSDERAEADAATDVAYQLAAAGAGVPLPRPVPRFDGRILLTAAEVAADAHARWRVYEWVDLAPDAPANGAEIGAVAATLHRLDHQAAAPPAAWFTEPVGLDGWADLLATADRARAWWAAPLREHLTEFVALDAIAAGAGVEPPDPGPLPTCHRDLNVENVRRRAGGQRAGGGAVVLDWENCGPLEPVREIAAVVADLRQDASPAEAVAAYAAYREHGGPHAVTRPADFSTAIVLQGHLLCYYGGRSVTAPDAGDRRRADRRLRTMLGRPLIRAGIADLLRALAPYA
jgi:Ser/Thr protein kinase RdoA (MazF antagonist)